MFGKYNGFVSKARVSACMYFLVYEFNTVLEVEDMGFMVGKSSPEPGSLKLHALVVAWNVAVVSRRENL
jgi:hypothetical protein